MKRLSKTDRELMLDALQAINSGELDKPELPDRLLDWPIWSAGENMPGYMPDTPYSLFLTERAARGYCRELSREAGGRNYVQDYMPTTLRECLS